MPVIAYFFGAFRNLELIVKNHLMIIQKRALTFQSPLQKPGYFKKPGFPKSMCVPLPEGEFGFESRGFPGFLPHAPQVLGNSQPVCRQAHQFAGVESNIA